MRHEEIVSRNRTASGARGRSSAREHNGNLIGRLSLATEFNRDFFRPSFDRMISPTSMRAITRSICRFVVRCLMRTKLQERSEINLNKKSLPLACTFVSENCGIGSSTSSQAGEKRLVKPLRCLEINELQAHGAIHLMCMRANERR